MYCKILGIKHLYTNDNINFKYICLHKCTFFMSSMSMDLLCFPLVLHEPLESRSAFSIKLLIIGITAKCELVKKDGCNQHSFQLIHDSDL
ncbi:DEAD box RNA helicase1 [Zea mays]|jgi:hypothetical protein|uniref:DEAD box RNA helicase1 n=1 Tax=Zea mays TaxID=4577 RepID=A0A1D6N3N1_MAIZE|nr:DEAD box RNA helicase1 [Zea mays]